MCIRDRNLIVCVKEREWLAWRMGTMNLIKQKAEQKTTFAKTAAKTVFDLFRKALSIEDKAQSG